VKNLPKTEAKASRREKIGGEPKEGHSTFAVVLFMRADSHKTSRALFAFSGALRARRDSVQTGVAVHRPDGAQVFCLQGRAGDGLTSGRWALVSGEFRLADGTGKKRFCDGPVSTPGHRFLPVESFRPDPAADPADIRSMRRNALGAGLGARTLTENATVLVCVDREKRLTVERA
jgi:hypothetical protein